MDASILRSVCLPLMYHDNDNWKERLNAEMKIHQNNFKELILTIENKFKNSDDQVYIIKGIRPVSDVMFGMRMYEFNRVFCSPNLAECYYGRRSGYRKLVELGDSLLPKLKDFAIRITLINDQLNDNKSAEFIIMYHLDIIQSLFIDFEQLNDLYYGIYNRDNDTLRNKFENSIQDKFSQLKNVFKYFIVKPKMNNKNALRRECITTNGMKDVLTDLHIEIVDKEGNNGTFNQLLNGGVSNP